MLENGTRVKGRIGGTLRGITDNLDYIKGMGVTVFT